jgi:hypothetical protein
MATTRTDWHDDLAAEMQEILTAASAYPEIRPTSPMSAPLLLGWGTVLLLGFVLWWLAALGLGRLTGWW